MKILQIFGAVVAVHLIAFIFIFASPGCQSSPRNVPTPDATVPTAGTEAPTVTYATPAETMPAAEGGTTTYTPETAPGRAAPTRPGSPNAAAVMPAKTVTERVAPVSTYTVQKGDSLWSIAKKNRLTVSELARANSVGTGATLQPGKKLIIPGKVPVTAPADLATPPASGKMVSAEKAGAARPAGIETVKHTVQPGETLGAIARRYQVKFGELAAANGITDPSKIRPGQELVIPGSKGAAKSAGAKAAAKTAPAAAAADKPAAPAPDSAAALTPHFDLKAPPPGQDLDAGLKGNTGTDVPTIKVDDVKTDDPNKK